MKGENLFMPRAKADVDAQVFWFAKRSHELALRFLEAAQGTALEIAQNPDSGSIYDDDYVGTQRTIRYRKVEGFPNHLMYFVSQPDGMRILRVLHSARRITASMIQDDWSMIQDD